MEVAVSTRLILARRNAETDLGRKLKPPTIQPVTVKERRMSTGDLRNDNADTGIISNENTRTSRVHHSTLRAGERMTMPASVRLACVQIRVTSPWDMVFKLPDKAANSRSWSLGMVPVAAMFWTASTIEIWGTCSVSALFKNSKRLTSRVQRYSHLCMKS